MTLGTAAKFEIRFTAEARAELNALKAFEQRQVVDAVQSKLNHEPFLPARNRKPLPGVTADFEFVPPLWELRVGELRVLYDGDDVNRLITIRAIRRKGPSQTTQEILS